MGKLPKLCCEIIAMALSTTVSGQWSQYSSDQLNTSNNVTIGTTFSTSPLTVGDNHGKKLSLGSWNHWQKTDIIKTGYDGTNFDHTDILVPGYENNDALLRLTKAGNVGIGTRNPAEKLSVNGKIRAHEIKVEQANWPDYVFDSNYQLPALAELEKFIRDHRHLPGIPSAKQVKENGIALGENQAALLKKIEEQALYIIQQEKRMEALEKRIASLEKLITK
ncbi:hypothetical protein ACTJIJ_22435 [Niabella sp. 22666]|jgi:hypothetical protein|uniref:hypothetical protein n=1 Tax=Niabella sp. 22666 TaxID=3453954 RepID=UPI003F826837